MRGSGCRVKAVAWMHEDGGFVGSSTVTRDFMHMPSCACPHAHALMHMPVALCAWTDLWALRARTIDSSAPDCISSCLIPGTRPMAAIAAHAFSRTAMIRSFSLAARLKALPSRQRTTAAMAPLFMLAVVACWDRSHICRSAQQADSAEADQEG